MEYWCKMKYANVVSLFITFNKYLPSGKGYCDFYLFIFSYVNATCLVRKNITIIAFACNAENFAIIHKVTWS